MEKNEYPNHFLMGAGVMMAGFVAGSILKSFTIDNARNAFLFAEEIKERFSTKPTRIVSATEPVPEEDSMEDYRYTSYYERTPPPTPPPSEEETRFKPPVPVAISRDEDEFYERMNEEAMAGRSLVDDWINV